MEAICPTCSPDEPTTHVILKEKVGLVKCEECGFVHTIPVKKEKVIKLRVIVSRQKESSVQEIEVNEDDDISVGDEFVVDTGVEVSGVKVQSIEMKTAARPERAKARDIAAIWARTIDEVIVKIAVQSGGRTESIGYKTSGDHEFVVGDVIKVKGYEVRITGIKIRDGAHLKRDGQIAKAKDIARIYSRVISESKFRPRERGGREAGSAG